MKQLKKRRLLLISCTIAIILFGVWFSTSNMYKFAKGYFLYKTHAPSSQVNETVQKPPSNKPPSNKTTKKELYPVRPETGEEIGELYIPKLKAKLPIFHGTNEDELEKGVGHFAGSVLPGENDNSVLSGHRDTVFRKLGQVGEGDLLIVRTSAGEFTYKVSKVRIVDEDDRTVIVPKPRATLTVSTCYPFDYIGAAPERYILVAYLASKKLS
ncbi:class D sortase [Peribacillus simplex]|uniref:Class D sortase n=2 Tax=Peribacillus simplex TaxID=1478 RepID=A0A223ED28_9BACI|nr:class D sortase [Peribacillus simplex]ASS93113.1 class D sortase [Peribacillus simplex NBRC 15720 = DSM 1321]MEC1400320.1 class D sortase [Peribacillus simplex]MED3912282.1 class D sortase [Peribacillus simplex]MED3984223.1 class D sortase [Peribacillus simplex]MED4097129.1 class D sortase [Peribacillus simplex]